jgi:pimeloyl-ACP methyl ester carboxylesterase
MDASFITVNETDRIAYQYEANGFRPEKDKTKLKKMDDGRIVRRLEDVVDQDKPTQKPLVIMVHDFPDAHAFLGEGRNLSDTYKDRLHFDGFPTLQFHFRGCGISDGRQQDFCFDTAVEDLNAVMEWASFTYGHDRFAIIAAGLGASVVAQTYNKDTMSSLVFLWPVFNPMDTPLNAINTLENRNFMTEHDYAQLGPNKIGLLLANEMRQLDTKPLLSQIKTATQIQQGTADTYTPYEKTDVIKQYLTGLVDFGVFEDGEHYLPDPKMRKQMVDNTLYFLNTYAYTKPPCKNPEIDKGRIFRNQGR